MSGFDIEALRTFVCVCELRSLTAAARHLGLTQAAISQRLKKLEAQARGPLIDRNFRPVKLTPSGDALFQQARGILANLARLQPDHAARSGATIASLRLGVTDSLGTALLPGLVPEITGIAERLLIRVDSSASLCHSLLQRDLDTIISTDPLSEHRGFEHHLLLREPIVLVHRRTEHSGSGSDDATLQWLAEHRPFLRYSPVSPLAQQIEAYLRRRGIDPPRNLEFSSSETIIDMVNHGLGWTITTPVILMQTRVKLTRLAIRRLLRGEMSRSIELIAREGEFGSLPLRVAKMSRRILARTVRHGKTKAHTQLLPLVHIEKHRP